MPINSRRELENAIGTHTPFYLSIFVHFLFVCALAYSHENSMLRGMWGAHHHRGCTTIIWIHIWRATNVPLRFVWTQKYIWEMNILNMRCQLRNLCLNIVNLNRKVLLLCQQISITICMLLANTSNTLEKHNISSCRTLLTIAQFAPFSNAHATRPNISATLAFAYGWFSLIKTTPWTLHRY